MPTGGASVLYTSLTRDGELAEISLPNPPEQAGLTARAVALGDPRRAGVLLYLQNAIGWRETLPSSPTNWHSGASSPAPNSRRPRE